MTISRKAYENGGAEVWNDKTQIGGIRNDIPGEYTVYVMGGFTPHVFTGTEQYALSQLLSLWETGKTIEER